MNVRPICSTKVVKPAPKPSSTSSKYVIVPYPGFVGAVHCRAMKLYPYEVTDIVAGAFGKAEDIKVIA